MIKPKNIQEVVAKRLWIGVIQIQMVDVTLAFPPMLVDGDVEQKDTKYCMYVCCMAKLFCTTVTPFSDGGVNLVDRGGPSSPILIDGDAGVQDTEHAADMTVSICVSLYLYIHGIYTY